MVDEIRQYWFVIRELTAREIKRKYARSVLGILWSVINPLLFMIVISVVMGTFTNNGKLYPVYYITGYTIWIMFYTATITSITAFIDNKMRFASSSLRSERF